LGSHPVAVVQYTYTHTNNTENNTKLYRTTQKIHRSTQKLGRVRTVPRLCGFYPGICLTTKEKARKNLSPSFCVSYAVTFCVLVAFTVLITILIIKEISVL